MGWNKAIDGNGLDRSSKGGLAINPDKTKVMKIGKWQGTDRIVIDEEVKDFCYLVSLMSSNSSCDKEIKTRMGKANSEGWKGYGKAMVVA